MIGSSLEVVSSSFEIVSASLGSVCSFVEGVSSSTYHCSFGNHYGLVADLSSDRPPCIHIVMTGLAPTTSHPRFPVFLGQIAANFSFQLPGSGYLLLFPLAMVHILIVWLVGWATT